jgi:nitrite reductase (NO-forming)
MAGEQLDSVAREKIQRQTMRSVRPLGRGVLAVAVAIPLLLGVVAGAIGGYILHASPSAASGKTDSISLSVYDFYFQGVGGTIDGVKNPTLNVSVGDQVVITITDQVTTMHNIYVDGFNAQSAHISGAGATAAVRFTASQQGTFAYYCAMPGHRSLGMEGKLVVGSGEGGSNSLPPIGPEVLPVSDIVRNATDVPPPITRTTSATVEIWLNATEVNAEIEPGVSYLFWTYGGKVPGPFFRVRVNDTVIVHFHNDAASMMTHSVDFHAVTGPGGGMAASMAAPGEYKNFSFKALVPGLFLYHCGTPDVPTHIANGMFGEILVQPDTPLPPVDHEFYVGQSELYTKWPIHTLGNQVFDDQKLWAETPTYFVFNGAWKALTGAHQLAAQVNQTVRIYFADGGPDFISSFHIIGEIFSRVWQYGDLTDPPLHGVQTVLVPPGGCVVVDLTLEYPGNYVLVDHALLHAVDMGAVGILNVTGPADSSIFNGGM